MGSLGAVKWERWPAPNVRGAQCPWQHDRLRGLEPRRCHQQRWPAAALPCRTNGQRVAPPKLHLRPQPFRPKPTQRRGTAPHQHATIQTRRTFCGRHVVRCVLGEPSRGTPAASQLYFLIAFVGGSAYLRSSSANLAGMAFLSIGPLASWHSIFANWPVGLMDKAPASGAGDSRLESCAGHEICCSRRALGARPRVKVRPQAPKFACADEHGQTPMPHCRCHPADVHVRAVCVSELNFIITS